MKNKLIRIIFFTILTVIIISSKEYPQGNFWQHTNGPYDGAFALALAKDPAGGIYAGTMTQGLYKSNDNGVTWSSIGPYGKTINAILPYTDQFIFASTEDGLIKTFDGGSEWYHPFSMSILIHFIEQETELYY